MHDEHWRQLRDLFDAVCDLPPQRWREALAGLSDDAALIEEALQLLGAQTDELGAVARPLQALLAGAEADARAAVEPRASDRLGAWLLGQRIGSGGMGTVFLAERADGLFRQRAAIKLLRGDGFERARIDRDEFARRLAAERQVLAELQHPNIARLYDGGSTPDGQPYLVMEYVQGEPLDEYCKRDAPDLERRLRLFQRICGAVQSAHQRLIVHCDLKPANVLVTEDGEPVLLDFGIAQALDRRLGEGAGGNAFCTPAYASPELLGGARVSVVSDVFALGVLLTELLACRALGRGVGDRETPVPAPSAWASPRCAWRGKLRGDLDAIAQRACALDPRQRYSSVEALSQDIVRHQAWRTVSARASSWRYRFGRYLRRHWREAAATASVLLLASGFVWRVSAERARAEREAAVAEQVSEFLVSAFDAADPSMRGARARQDVSARQVLDASAARIGHGLDATPAIRARLRAVLGRAYRNLGQPQRAEALLEQAAREFLDPAVARPDRAAQAFTDLSRSLSERQYGPQAVAAAQRALELRQRQGEARGLAEAYDALALARVADSRYDLAEAAFARSQEVRRKHAMRQSLQERAAMLGNLGQLYRRRGELRRAESAFREALELVRAESAHSVAAQVQQFYLAKVLFGQGRVAETRRELVDNLDLARDLYGEQSDMVANIHVDIGDAAQDMGDYRIADEHYRAALAIMARVAGARSLDYARVLNNYATLADERGDVGEAERLWREALAIRREQLDPHERRVLRVEGYIGRLIARAGRAEEARPLVERALAVWRARYADDRAGVLTAQLGRVEWLLSRERLDEAARELDAVDLGQGEYNAFLLAKIPALRAELAQRRGDRAGAVRGWAQVVAESARRNGDGQVLTAKARVPYAEALRANGEGAAAQAQLERAAPLLRRELHRDSDLLRRIEAMERDAAVARADPGPRRRS
ncbi:tetratricopeptide repeat protein [Lysobacter sp. K5869]|uniref:serine/threonine-protein kinase n=1 Tax=Lysobacter sp. K5869 TaxID=2820808 RepID=UPI001C0623A2|nr:serine/threonine-protein kinase [Lysobacter sp. K5869]QWP78527.1 tetratricopeptide repeat protein [Lysobacter sp. K5869]